MVELRKFNTEAKVELIFNLYFIFNNILLLQLNGCILTIYVLQNYLLLTYDHDIIYKWFSKNFPRKSMSPKDIHFSTKNKKSTLISNRKCLFEKVMENLCISGWIDFQHILANVRLHDQHSSIGFNRFRVILDQDQSKRGEIYFSTRKIYFGKINFDYF